MNGKTCMGLNETRLLFIKLGNPWLMTKTPSLLSKLCIYLHICLTSAFLFASELSAQKLSISF
jgi:hypothetical protein